MELIHSRRYIYIYAYTFGDIHHVILFFLLIKSTIYISTGFDDRSDLLMHTFYVRRKTAAIFIISVVRLYSKDLIYDMTSCSVIC